MKYEIKNNNKIIDFTFGLIQKVETNATNVGIQNKVVQKITENIWNVIDKNNARNKIHDVSLQGSFAKGTDLPTSGSDLDIFVIFKDDFDTDFGLEIGMEALKQYNPRPIQAKVKFAEAIFEVDGLEIEVQIVPIIHRPLSDIQSKVDSHGNPIKEIGMERTPHQTEFMIENLTEKRTQVKMLKQFMKDIDVYDSSIVSQGLSGYMAECLIHNKGTFIEVVKFFANFVRGSTVGELNKDKIYETKFNLADPIDPNRNLIHDTVSNVKLARMIVMCRYLLLNAEIPERKTVDLKSVGISFKSTESEKERQGSQLNSALKTITKALNSMGFEIQTEKCIITDDYTIQYPYMTSHITKDNEVTFALGVGNTETRDKIVKSRIKKNLPEKAIQAFKSSNEKYECEETDEELIIWIDNDCKTIEKALNKILKTNIDQSGLPEGIKRDMKQGVAYAVVDSLKYKCLM